MAIMGIRNSQRKAGRVCRVIPGKLGCLCECQYMNRVCESNKGGCCMRMSKSPLHLSVWSGYYGQF